jgi:hypothetical protein
MYDLIMKNEYGTKIGFLHQTFEGAPIHKSSTYTIMKEKVISDYDGLMLPLNHFMFEALNDKIIQLQESGIMQKLFETSYRNANATDDDPQPLSFTHLIIWFQLWCGLLLISILFFFLEVLMRKMSKVRNNNCEN